MMNPPFTLSRKTQHSIQHGVDKLKHGSFTEIDIKTLLIDLREPAKYMLDSMRGDTNNQLKIQLKELIEVCNFIAHPSRNRGIIEAAIRKQANKLYKGLELPPDEFWSIPVDDVVNASRVVATLSVIMGLAILKPGELLSSKYMMDILESHADDIVICILSLIQESRIDLDQEEGVGFLQLIPHEGFYRIYCRLVDSRIEREAKARTGGSGKLIMGFPVMISGAACKDENFLSHDFTAFPPLIFETYRDDASQLKLRPVG